MEIIKTRRLELRPFSPEDREALGALLTNDTVKQMYMIPDFEQQEQLWALVSRFEALSREENRFVRGIYLQNRLIGFVNDVEQTRDMVELGYVIHPDHQNRGYATEALRAVIKVLLETRFSVIRAGAFRENPASLRVMEKAGMVPISHRETIQYRGKNHECSYCEFTKGF